MKVIAFNCNLNSYISFASNLSALFSFVFFIFFIGLIIPLFFLFRYGKEGVGEDIPPNQDLLFRIRLIEGKVKKPSQR
jgi:hypothetical protein